MKKIISIAIILIIPCHFIFSQTKVSDNKVELLIPNSERIDPGWGSGTEDFRNLEILDKIDETSSERRFKEAARDYRISIDIFQNTESSIESKKEEYEQEVNPQDRYEWQKRAREDARNRELAKLLNDGRNQAVQYLIRGMTTLDKIENPTVKSQASFLDLKAGLYREYAKHQFSMKNYIPVTDILLRYIQLNEKYEKESEPHKILAFCFEKMQMSALKNKKYEIADDFKEKKNRHLITFAELHYGKSSTEYQTISEKVMKDY
ncbi:FcpA-related putative periplasmic flagellar protein [Leptospira sp. GIMC2001]|uniref:FcpA-related putative periplasmic flagellar protein n=1 Tax=Leptospira sp. GIMC2001 TaxID=1513297 RepID=UPI00234AAD9E|nr:hypothetical protein [Leptospira sp. GIMC2001]WCL48049.1 hypothetical protein O4O04_12050 [Leptospira sp. GIMC2001]